MTLRTRIKRLGRKTKGNSSAIDNFAYDNNIALGEARMQILRSRACESLYDFDSHLWAGWPDYFIAFYEAVEKNDVNSEIIKETLENV